METNFLQALLKELADKKPGFILVDKVSGEENASPSVSKEDPVLQVWLIEKPKQIRNKRV